MAEAAGGRRPVFLAQYFSFRGYDSGESSRFSSTPQFRFSGSPIYPLSQIIFPGTALILSLQERFRFTPAEVSFHSASPKLETRPSRFATLLLRPPRFNHQIGYVLAYLLCSRFFVLVIIFPFVLKGGRRAFHRWQLRHPIHRSGPIEAGTHPITDETTPLLDTTEVAQPGEVLVVEDPASLSNHFDGKLASFPSIVSSSSDSISLSSVLLACFSLLLDASGYLGVYFSSI